MSSASFNRQVQCVYCYSTWKAFKDNAYLMSNAWGWIQHELVGTAKPYFNMSVMEYLFGIKWNLDLLGKGKKEETIITHWEQIHLLKQHYVLKHTLLN